jgi:Uma2 family endonuclease
MQAISQLMSFQEFLAWKPETGRYELHEGVIVERRYIGSPKQPTVTVGQLVKGVYETRLFRRGEPLVSPQFPGLKADD